MKNSFYRSIPLELVAIIVFGIIIRIIATFNLSIIENDGVVYIQQARALLSGDFSGVFSCDLTNLPLSTVFIAGAYLLVGDWLIAAHGISLVFGSAMLIPLAMILRCFFDRKIVFLGVATFSVLPVFVYTSVYILREPVFIFFITLGLCCFIKYLNEYKKQLLIYSSLCFMLGAWARIEGLFIIPLAAIFIVIYCHKEKFSHLLFFLALPAAFVLLFEAFLINTNIMSTHVLASRSREVFYGTTLAYGSLKQAVLSIDFSEQHIRMSLFLKEAGDQIWLIGAGTVIRNLIKALHYFFFFILLLGLKDAWSFLKFDKRIIFLSSVAMAGMFVIYISCLAKWVPTPRYYTGIVLIPLSFLICCGFKRFLYLLENRVNLNARWSFLLVVTVVLLICLPKDLKTGDKDKRVFRDIANEISKYEDTTSAIKIATSFERNRWINFYSNYDFLSASDIPWCNLSKDFLWEYFPKNYEDFDIYIKKKNIDYFLWEQRAWQKGKFLFNSSRLDEYFDRIGEWYHPDTGDMVLYRRKKNNNSSF